MDPTQQPQPTQPQPTAPQWWTDFLQQYGGANGWTPSDDDMAMFANALLMFSMQQQMGQLDYQNQYLQYLQDTVGLNQQQLALAQRELEFQQGPYFDWYTSEYFPAIQEQERLRLDTARETAKYGQLQAKDYALAQAYNTEAAKYGAQSARYNMMAQQGLNWSMPSYGATGY